MNEGRGKGLRDGARLLLGVLLLVLSGCVAADRLQRLDAQRWQDAQQMVLVLVPDWDATQGTLHTFARDGDGWREVGSAAPSVIGRSGAAWGLGLNSRHGKGPLKREGDGRSPAGVFAIGAAFGYADHVATALDYAAMQASDWCVDVSGSPLYNRIVDSNEVGVDAVKGASEHMRLDLFQHGDQRYRLGFVIEHNAQQQAGAGSCIFAHLWNGPSSSTSGCTAMADPTMQRLLGWLDPKQQPVFVLLPQAEYARLHDAWNLPRVETPP